MTVTVVSVSRISPQVAEVTLEDRNPDFAAAIESLASVAARNLAIDECSKQGVSGQLGINRMVMPAYPVNCHGATIEIDMKDADGNAYPVGAAERQPVAYRSVYSVMSR
jgi:hypothetical protein